jgi:hypothetical protein
MNPEMLDILIGKYLDSEITPAEQALLDRQLSRDEQARAMLDQFQRLDRIARQTVQESIGNQGSSFEAIFSRALAQHRPARVKIAWIRRFRLPAAVAAGFLIGLLSIFLYVTESYEQNKSGPTKQPPPQIAIDKKTPIIEPQNLDQPELVVPQRQRQTDFYTFTDPRGSQWLIEAHRDNDVALTSYTGDL